MVYTSAEVYMIQDSSQEFENTWNFVDRQLACYVRLGQRVREVRTACSGTWILAHCDCDYSCMFGVIHAWCTSVCVFLVLLKNYFYLLL